MHKQLEDVVEEELCGVDVQAKFNGNVYCYLLGAVLDRALVLAQEALWNALAQLLQNIFDLPLDLSKFLNLDFFILNS